jgi:hypothetical protein
MSIVISTSAISTEEATPLETRLAELQYPLGLTVRSVGGAQITSTFVPTFTRS